MPEGLDFIKNSKLDIKEDEPIELNIDNNEKTPDYNALIHELTDLKNNLTTSLQDQIEILKKQCNNQQIQLEEKDKQLDSKDELLKNFQILLKSEQENIKLLKQSNKSIFDIFRKKN